MLGSSREVFTYLNERNQDTYYILFYYQNGFYEIKETKKCSNSSNLLRKLFDSSELSHYSIESKIFSENNDDTSMLEEELSKKLNLKVLPNMVIKPKILKLVEIDNKKYDQDRQTQKILETLNVTRINRGNNQDDPDDPGDSYQDDFTGLGSNKFNNNIY